MRREEVRTIRVDVPSAKHDTHLLFFVHPSELPAEPWWSEFVEFLLDLEPKMPAGTHPESGARMEVCTLGQSQQEALRVRLEIAPPSEIAVHPVLQRATKRLQQTSRAVRVVFFWLVPE